MSRGTEVAQPDRLLRASSQALRARAFRDLVDRHLAASYGLARAILGDATEAEDATHDAFEIAWRAWGSLRDPSRFEHWFDRILVNTCRNRLRRRRALILVRDISADVSVDPGRAVARTDDRDQLGRAIAALNPDHRVVLALRFYGDLPIEAIAVRTGVPTGTVKSRLHHALRALRAALAAESPAGEP